MMANAENISTTSEQTKITVSTIDVSQVLTRVSLPSSVSLSSPSLFFLTQSDSSGSLSSFISPILTRDGSTSDHLRPSSTTIDNTLETGVYSSVTMSHSSSDGSHLPPASFSGPAMESQSNALSQGVIGSSVKSTIIIPSSQLSSDQEFSPRSTELGAFSTQVPPTHSTATFISSSASTSLSFSLQQSNSESFQLGTISSTSLSTVKPFTFPSDGRSLSGSDVLPLSVQTYYHTVLRSDSTYTFVLTSTIYSTQGVAVPASDTVPTSAANDGGQESDQSKNSHEMPTSTKVAVGVTVPLGLIFSLLLLSVVVIWFRRRMKRQGVPKSVSTASSESFEGKISANELSNESSRRNFKRMSATAYLF